MELNTITLAGRLGKDPYIHNGKNGKAAFISFAESERWKDKSGEWQERTRWHNAVINREHLVKKAEEKAEKGDTVLITGKLEYKKHKEHSEVDVAFISVATFQVEKKATRADTEINDGDGMGGFDDDDDDLPI